MPAADRRQGARACDDGARLVSSLFDGVFDQLGAWREEIGARASAETTPSKLDDLVATLVLPSLTADDAATDRRRIHRGPRRTCGAATCTSRGGWVRSTTTRLLGTTDRPDPARPVHARLR